MRNASQEMTLSEIVQAEHIVPDLQSTDRWEAITELIGQLVSSGAIKEEHREAITEVVKKRENSMSTGIGFGCLLYTSPSPRDQRGSRMPSSA